MSKAKTSVNGPATGSRPAHAVHVDETAKRQLLLRLRRIEGQVRGVQRMVEEERYCPQVMEQISAVQESLRGVGRILLRNHLRHCVAGAIRSGDEARSRRMYDELAALFFKHAR